MTPAEREKLIETLRGRFIDLNGFKALRIQAADELTAQAAENKRLAAIAGPLERLIKNHIEISIMDCGPEFVVSEVCGDAQPKILGTGPGLASALAAAEKAAS